MSPTTTHSKTRHDHAHSLIVRSSSTFSAFSLSLCLSLTHTHIHTNIYSCYPISGATFTQEGYELQKLAASNVGALLLTLFLCIRLYSGWGYVGSRLKSRVIEYEETGWYDGDMEEKSPAERQRDMFLYQSNVQPVENRLKTVTLALAGLWVASCLGLNLALNAKPLFDKYNPKMLERLQYDDKLSDVVREQSNGRPTYCDSRYYRAVANGGQGCD